LGPRRRKGEVVRDRSASCFRQPGRIAFGFLLLTLLGGVPVPPARGGDIEAQLEQLLRNAGPGIVKIDVRRAWGPDSGAPPARVNRGQMPVRRIQGNGIVWDGFGHIVTVADLAQPGDTIRVFGPDGSMGRGEFVGQDVDLGISLIHVHGLSSIRPLPRGTGLPPAPAWILTIFYPGVVHPLKSLAHLSVSRTERGIGSVAPQARGRIEGVVDPALAGGGVLNGDGRLIGILLGEGSESLLLLDPGRAGSPVEYSIRSPGPSEAGWIVPVGQLDSAIAPLLQSGGAGQGFLGVRVDLPPGQVAPKNGPGVPLASVLPGSPAAIAGLLPGDRLVGFDGAPVLSWDELTQRVAAVRPGQTVRVDFIRAGKGATVNVRIEDRAHSIWRQKQRQMSNGREKLLRHQIEGLRQQLELLRHQLSSAY
jgi:serine protease DegS